MTRPREWFSNLCSVSNTKRRCKELFPIIEWAPKVRIFPFLCPLSILSHKLSQSIRSKMRGTGWRSGLISTLVRAPLRRVSVWKVGYQTNWCCVLYLEILDNALFLPTKLKLVRVFSAEEAKIVREFMAFKRLVTIYRSSLHDRVRVFLTSSKTSPVELTNAFGSSIGTACSIFSHIHMFNF